MLSLFDRLWHKDLTEEEAVKLMELGIEEVSHFDSIIPFPFLLSDNCREVVRRSVI